jgi:hypothetical protein
MHDMPGKTSHPSTSQALTILKSAAIFADGRFHTARCAFCDFSVTSQIGATVLRRLMTHKCEGDAPKVSSS